MKKAIYILIITSLIIFVFCACDKKPDISKMNESEIASYVEESVASERESASAREENIQKAVVKTEKEIGKSVKGKKLVIKNEGGSFIEYQVINFGKNKYPTTKLIYRYFDDDNDFNYYMKINYPDNQKIKDSDKELRCIVVETKMNIEMTYDQWVERYSDTDLYTVIQ